MKLTKRHYNRKVVSFGIMMFLAIALISTGFATWIMSNGAENNSQGNASVGVIADGSLEFKDVKFTNNIDTFLFEPEENDTTGEIKYKDVAENLVVEITGTVTPAVYLDDLTIQVEMPAGIKAAAAAGYIQLPECCSSTGVVIIENGTAKDGGSTFSATVNKSEGVNEATFTFKIVLKWGSKFHNENPSVTLDNEINPETSEAYTFAEKRELMLDFKKTIYGFTVVADNSDSDPLTMTEEEILSYNQAIKYDVTLTATTN